MELEKMITLAEFTKFMNKNVRLEFYDYDSKECKTIETRIIEASECINIIDGEPIPLAKPSFVYIIHFIDDDKQKKTLLFENLKKIEIL
jgi:hypothetical protein